MLAKKTIQDWYYTWRKQGIAGLTAYLKLPVPQRRLIRETILTFAKVHAESALPPS
ncbi:hypothetical protein [Rhodoferax sp.]|uniref:hypothetical protein n=1 Tax=Rhodoferax sp. TaxID=50421 RepID=UPI0026283ED2|nr:hypothetical protein [Rhodoferax sp.]MDD2810077.1 hypothetical protein [Rhodoferax sp.]MDD4943759.1 hypothetical protein [Rhodoferax sp.]